MPRQGYERNPQARLQCRLLKQKTIKTKINRYNVLKTDVTSKHISCERSQNSLYVMNILFNHALYISEKGFSLGRRLHNIRII